MSKSGMGSGSASLVLIFAVLCLTIFALISLASANADHAHSHVLSMSVSGYYSADTQAENILDKLRAAADNGEYPDEIDGIFISYDAEEVSFFCPFTSGDAEEAGRALYVRAKPAGVGWQICQWQVKSAEDDWTIEEGIGVWDGA